jgi:hypothetical protein
MQSSPIPPYEKLFDFLMLIVVLKVLQNTMVEAFRVCNSIGSGKDGRGAESESGLPNNSTFIPKTIRCIPYLGSNISN